MPRFESDVCIIGGGISAVFLAQKLSELKPNLSITIVEAGKRLFDAENRMSYRRRSALYGENAWPGDFIEDQGGAGVISRTMAVGGSAMHWQGHANRFSEEDLRLHSLYGLAVDWPLEWAELEKYCCEAERRIGVSGEPSSYLEDKRSEPYPMPLMPLTYNLAEIKAWAERAGRRKQQHRREFYRLKHRASRAKYMIDIPAAPWVPGKSEALVTERAIT